MTDIWFIQEIERHLKTNNRTVILDPHAQFAYLLPLIESKGHTVLSTNNTLKEDWQTVKEELYLRYEAEKNYSTSPVVFYTSREMNNLSFLFDYCFTHGCLDLSNPGEWLRKKLFSQTGLQINMENPLLLTAAKLGIGKDLNWWKRILQNLEDLISIDVELLPFLNDPEGYMKKKDPDVRRLFEEKLFELIGQPYMRKPPTVLAKEVVKIIFDQLLNNSISGELLTVYYKWLDSNSYTDALKAYISDYKISDDQNVWTVHPDHCFDKIDRWALKKISENLRDSTYTKNALAKIRRRVFSSKSNIFLPSWWNDVVTLLEYDNKSIAECNNLDKLVDYYTTNFHHVDRSIRNLFVCFLQEDEIIRPFQEYYDSLNYELLQHWFDHADAYKSNQQAFLPDLIKNSSPAKAIIVGDGLRYEIASFVASVLEKEYKVQKNIMLADIPSETEHNMSALYLDNKEVLPIHKDREKKLSVVTGKEITFLNLEALHYGIKSDYLVLTYKDIDSTGEKLQLGAIKLFAEFEKVLIDKIGLLMKMGYEEVYLITDHGFVLTGLLDESDKIEPAVSGKKEVHERFIRTIDKQYNSDLVEFEKKYGEFNYIYVTKNQRPFKSKGMYGFSHGGFTPQEVIIPQFVFRKKSDHIEGLKIIIDNKKDLAEVTGNLFEVKIQAQSVADSIFSLERKVKLMVYANKIAYTSSSIITLSTGSSYKAEFSFESNEEVMVVLVDASTQEQLDIVKVKKSGARDLGGLL